MGWHEEPTKSSEEEFDHRNGSTYETYKPNDENDYLTPIQDYEGEEYISQEEGLTFDIFVLCVTSSIANILDVN